MKWLNKPDIEGALVALILGLAIGAFLMALVAGVLVTIDPRF